MRTLRYAAILLAACAWAEEASDRAAIEKVVIAFNHPEERAAVLARDADLGPLPPGYGPEPWSEISSPHFASHRVLFVTQDVAVVDASASLYGTMILKRTVPAIFVMRREATGWKVVLLRIGAP